MLLLWLYDSEWYIYVILCIENACVFVISEMYMCFVYVSFSQRKWTTLLTQYRRPQWQTMEPWLWRTSRVPLATHWYVTTQCFVNCRVPVCWDSCMYIYHIPNRMHSKMVFYFTVCHDHAFKSCQTRWPLIGLRNLILIGQLSMWWKQTKALFHTLVTVSNLNTECYVIQSKKCKQK